MTENLLYTQLFEKVMTERPDLAPYVELFQQASNSNGNREPESSKDLESRLRKLSSTVRMLKEDLDHTLFELDDLAKALGACEECWGRDKQCPKCQGDGKSGSRKIDKGRFNRLVLPALRKASWIELKEKPNM